MTLTPEAITYTSGNSVWLFVIFFILLFWFFAGNNRLGGRDVLDYSTVGCGRVSNCEVEKQGIINSATTQFLIEEKANQTQSLLGQKIDFYQMQNQAEKLNDAKLALLAKDQTIERLQSEANANARFCQIQNQLTNIENTMFIKPNVYPYSYICPPNPCCNSCCGM